MTWQARLAARAHRAAAKPQTVGFRRFWFFGERVVPLERYLLSEAKSHRSHQKDVNRLTHIIHLLERGVARRQRSLVAAGEYIDLLKARVRAYHPDYGPLYGTDSKEP